MILTISENTQNDLTFAGIAAAALLGAGITQPFKPDNPGGQPLPSRPAPVGGGGIEVQCDESEAPFAKAAFVAIGFDVRESTGPARLPVNNNLTTLTAKPALPDDKYPVGADETGRCAATALCAAGVTQAFADNGDPFRGDPATAMQVNCDRSDIPRVTGGFVAVGFTTE